MSIRIRKLPRDSDDEDENRDWKGSWILPTSPVGPSPTYDDVDNKEDLKDIKRTGNNSSENITGIVACSGIDGYYMDVEDNYEMENMVGVLYS